MKESLGGATHYETSPDATLIVSDSGIIRRANAAALALFGYSRDELVGCALDCLMPERLRDRHRAHVEHYFRRPYARHVALPTQLLALCKDGRELDVDISLGRSKRRMGRAPSPYYGRMPTPAWSGRCARGSTSKPS